MRKTISKPTTPASKDPILNPISNLHRKQISLADDVKLEVEYDDEVLRIVVVVTLICEYYISKQLSYMSTPS